MKKKCKICGKEFETYRKNAVYCGYRCRMDNKIRLNVEAKKRRESKEWLK